MFSAWGSVGGPTKAQLGPVLSCGGCWPAGRTAGSRPTSPRMPTQHARKTKEEWRGGWAWRERLPGASWSPSPREAERLLLLLWRMGSTSLYPLEQGSRASRFQGHLLQLLLNCPAALFTQWLIVLVCLCFCGCAGMGEVGPPDRLSFTFPGVRYAKVLICCLLYNQSVSLVSARALPR